MAGTPDISVVNVLAELERYGVAYKYHGQDELLTLCPFHDDSNPSCHISVPKKLFKCYTAGCDASGDIVTFLSGVVKQPRVVILRELSDRYELEQVKAIDPQLVERYHKQIWNAGVLLAELYKRGVTDDDIRKYRLGVDERRITIPIKNNSGTFVNIRKYLPGAPGAEKMKNVKGHGQQRLWPQEQLKFDKIVICGGEIKAIVAARQLNPAGIGAITATGGEGNWNVKFNSDFKGKHVWVCLDVDSEGQSAAQSRCAVLHKTAAWIGNVLLPLDRDKYPKGDINDFIATERGNMLPLLHDAEQWEPLHIEQALDESPPEQLELHQSNNAIYTGKRVEVSAVIAAMQQTPFIIPAAAEVICSKDQNECAFCPVFQSDDPIHAVHCESSSILEMVGQSKDNQHLALQRAFQIPPTCRVCRFKPTEYYNVEDVRINPRLEITNRSTERVMQPAYCVGRGLELNESYTLTGRMYPHPKTQASTLLISKQETTQDALSTYQPTELEQLQIFQPDQWCVESLQEKLDEIYADFEFNVTQIFQRREIHLLTDLAYHSVLWFNLNNKGTKGWADVLILGDSAQGKSETVINLQRHYGLGEKVECKNATVAGLLGGLQMISGQWFVSWGIIPTQDKRLVLLEELKGAPQEIIAKLTDMRSSGIAEIPKIEKRRTHARTRLISTSNPRSRKEMSSYNFGIEAILELIGSLEDIRRYDAIAIVNARDVDSRIINLAPSEREYITHQFTSELCRKLVLWGWTRREDQIAFDDSAVREILSQSVRLTDKYTDAIPIVDRGSIRNKLARLAVALAVRTFSTGEDKSHIFVRQCHVQYIAKFLDDMYSRDSFGYAAYSEAEKSNSQLVSPDELKRKINLVPFPRDFISQSLHTAIIDKTDIMDWCGYDREQAGDLLSLLVRKHALVRDGRAYRKTPPYILLLKDMLNGGGLEDRPEFIRDEF